MMTTRKTDDERFPEELAKNAYLQYGSVTDMKNYQGNPMPDFENLPDKIKEAWKLAAIYCYDLGHMDALM
jgi:hypothetical protein